MLDLALVEPGFFKRRVKRPNPMNQWDEKTQENIKNDFDALRKELLAEHNSEECQKLDNAFVSEQYQKYKGHEKKGRELLKGRFGPLTFFRGIYLLGLSRFALFSLGHEVLHGTFRTHEDPMFQGRTWTNTLFINDQHWKRGHNQGHHKAPGVFGLDPESSPSNFRGSDDFYAERGDRIVSLISSYILNFHTLFFIGIVEAKHLSLSDENVWKEWWITFKTLFKKEYFEYPKEAGINAPRVVIGNFLSFIVAEVVSGFLGRTTHIRADTTCLHVNEFDLKNRAHFYIVSLLNAGNITLKSDRDLYGWDTHIEHHLFPFLSTRMLAKAGPRVKAICEKYDLPYHEGDFWTVFKVAYILDFKKLVTK
ncbi:MAG: fatty acid desaturase [Pseudomonadales bacterium]|nr:fatty acid desaturase [Pseudomonadales bacterium]